MIGDVQVDLKLVGAPQQLSLSAAEGKPYCEGAPGRGARAAMPSLFLALLQASALRQ